MMKVLLLSVVVCAAAIIDGVIVRSGDFGPADESAPSELLRQFTTTWDESSWTEKSRRAPDGYMLSNGTPARLTQSQSDNRPPTSLLSPRLARRCG